jgi:hypothetical protein
VLLSCDPNGRILVVGARGASKRGVRAALYRVEDVSAALDSNVVFAKSSVSDQLVDASQPSRVLALECVAARHVALHSETLRSDELMLVLGAFTADPSALAYRLESEVRVADAESAFHRPDRVCIVPCERGRLSLVALAVSPLRVSAWNGRDAPVNCDLQLPVLLVPQWPSICVTRTVDTRLAVPTLLFTAATERVAGSSAQSVLQHVPLHASLLAGMDAVTAVHLAEASAYETHLWIRVQLLPSGATVPLSYGWPDVLPNSVASLAQCVSVNAHARTAWIATKSNSLLYCAGGQLVHSVSLGAHVQVPRLRLLPIELANELGASVAVFDGDDVIVCDATSEHVRRVANVASALRLASGALLCELRSGSVLGAIAIVSQRAADGDAGAREQSDQVIDSVAEALSRRVQLSHTVLERNGALLVAKESLLRSRLALLHGRADADADSTSSGAMRLVTLVAGSCERANAPAAMRTDEPLGVSIVDAALQHADPLTKQPMRVACVLRVHCDDAAAGAPLLGDVSMSVISRGQALRAKSYSEAVSVDQQRAMPPQVAALAHGCFGKCGVSDVRVACEVETDEAIATEHAMLLIRWRWFRLADDGRVEAHGSAATHRFLSLQPALCRVVPSGIAFLPVSTTLFVLPTLAQIESDRLTRCIASTLGVRCEASDALVGERVRVRVIVRDDSGGSGGGGAIVQLRCAAAVVATSATERLRQVLRVEFDADVVAVSGHGTAERLLCGALTHECGVLRSFVEASRTGRPVDLARVSETAVATSMVLKQTTLH